MNVFRNAGSVLGIVAALGIRPIAEAFGGGPEGFLYTGLVMGVAVSVPWFGVWWVSFERPDFQARDPQVGLVEGVKIAAANPTFLRLIGLYLGGRIAMDLTGAMLVLYFTYWMGRSGDFEPVMGLFMTVVMLLMPFWTKRSDGTRGRGLGLPIVKNTLDRLGVTKLLRRAGVREGDVVWIGEFSFEYRDEEVS